MINTAGQAQTILVARNRILKRIAKEKSNQGGILVSKGGKYGTAYDYVYAADTVHGNFYVFEGKGYDVKSTGNGKAVNLMVQQASAYFNYKFHYNTQLMHGLDEYIAKIESCITANPYLYVILSPFYRKNSSDSYAYCIKGKVFRDILSCFTKLDSFQISDGVPGTMYPSMLVSSGDGEVIAKLEKVSLELVNKKVSPKGMNGCLYLYLNPTTLLFDC